MRKVSIQLFYALVPFLITACLEPAKVTKKMNEKGNLVSEVPKRPNSPFNATAKFINQTLLFLSWAPPVDTAGELTMEVQITLPGMNLSFVACNLTVLNADEPIYTCEAEIPPGNTEPLKISFIAQNNSGTSPPTELILTPTPSPSPSPIPVAVQCAPRPTIRFESPSNPQNVKLKIYYDTRFGSVPGDSNTVSYFEIAVEAENSSNQLLKLMDFTPGLPEQTDIGPSWSIEIPRSELDKLNTSATRDQFAFRVTAQNGCAGGNLGPSYPLVFRVPKPPAITKISNIFPFGGPERHAVKIEWNLCDSGQTVGRNINPYGSDSPPFDPNALVGMNLPTAHKIYRRIQGTSDFNLIQTLPFSPTLVAVGPESDPTLSSYVENCGRHFEANLTVSDSSLRYEYEIVASNSVGSSNILGVLNPSLEGIYRRIVQDPLPFSSAHPVPFLSASDFSVHATNEISSAQHSTVTVEFNDTGNPLYQSIIRQLYFNVSLFDVTTIGVRTPLPFSCPPNGTINLMSSCQVTGLQVGRAYEFEVSLYYGVDRSLASQIPLLATIGTALPACVPVPEIYFGAASGSDKIQIMVTHPTGKIPMPDPYSSGDKLQLFVEGRTPDAFIFIKNAPLNASVIEVSKSELKSHPELQEIDSEKATPRFQYAFRVVAQNSCFGMNAGPTPPIVAQVPRTASNLTIVNEYPPEGQTRSEVKLGWSLCKNGLTVGNNIYPYGVGLIGLNLPTEHHIYRRIEGSSDFQLLQTIAFNANVPESCNRLLSANIPTPNDGNRYEYKLTSSNLVGDSEASFFIDPVPFKTPPLIQNFTSTVVTTTTVTFAWNNPISGELYSVINAPHHFDILMREVSTGQSFAPISPCTNIAYTADGSYQCTVSGLLPGVRYEAFVVAVNKAAGENRGGSAPALSITTLNSPTPPTEILSTKIYCDIRFLKPVKPFPIDTSSVDCVLLVNDQQRSCTITNFSVVTFDTYDVVFGDCAIDVPYHSMVRPFPNLPIPNPQICPDPELQSSFAGAGLQLFTRVFYQWGCNQALWNEPYINNNSIEVFVNQNDYDPPYFGSQSPTEEPKITNFLASSLSATKRTFTFDYPQNAPAVHEIRISTNGQNGVIEQVCRAFAAPDKNCIVEKIENDKIRVTLYTGGSRVTDGWEIKEGRYNIALYEESGQFLLAKSSTPAFLDSLGLFINKTLSLPPIASLTNTFGGRDSFELIFTNGGGVNEQSGNQDLTITKLGFVFPERPSPFEITFQDCLSRVLSSGDSCRIRVKKLRPVAYNDNNELRFEMTKQNGESFPDGYLGLGQIKIIE